MRRFDIRFVGYHPDTGLNRLSTCMYRTSITRLETPQKKRRQKRQKKTQKNEGTKNDRLKHNKLSHKSEHEQDHTQTRMETLNLLCALTCGTCRHEWKRATETHASADTKGGGGTAHLAGFVTRRTC